MPLFIDNKGRYVVPSLATLAMANGRLGDWHITCFDPTMKRFFEEEIQRLGCVARWKSRHPAIYLTKDLSAVMIGAPPLNFNINGTVREYVAPIGNTLLDENTDGDANDRELWELAKVGVSLHLPRIAAIIVEPPRSLTSTILFSENKHIMMISLPLLTKLANDGIDLRPIERLVIQDIGGNLLPGEWLSTVSTIRSLSLMHLPPCLSPLLPLSDTLEELRVVVDPSNFTGIFEGALSQMSSLKLLFAECHISVDAHPLSINWELLKLSPKMRSLTLLGIAPATSADIISFLTKEMMKPSGNSVERQELLDDFTVTGVEKDVMEEIYRSDALTERMKERIFCDITLRHLISAFLLVSKKNDYSMAKTSIPFFKKAKELLTTGERPPGNMIRVVLEVVGQMRVHGYCMWYGLPLLSELLRPMTMTERHPVNRCFLDTLLGVVLASLDRFQQSLHIGLATKLITEFTAFGVQPSNVGHYLQVIVFLIDYYDVPGPLLPTLFMFHAKKLCSPIHVFLGKMQAPLLRICFLKLLNNKVDISGPSHPLSASPQVDVDLPEPMIDMLIFILQSTRERDLQVAVNAVLRRSTKGPHHGKWYTLDTDAEERCLYRKILIAKVTAARLS